MPAFSMELKNVPVKSMNIAMKPVNVRLEVSPGKDKKRVRLPAPYYSWTDQDRKSMKLVQEGNVCTLRQEGDCALVGPLSPCQMHVLHLGNTTVVAHAYFNADTSSFLDIAERKFEAYEPDSPFSGVTGTIFTTHCSTYEDPSSVQIGDSFYSWKNLYQGRGQRGEIRRTKNAIIERFGIKKRAQIDDNFFTYEEENKENVEFNKYEFAELGNYPFASLYILAKHNVVGKPSLYSACPMAENMDNFHQIPEIQKLSHEQRIITFARAWKSNSLKNNPFFKQQEQADPSELAQYGKFPYVEI
jgi:hypothetical protein